MPAESLPEQEKESTFVTPEAPWLISGAAGADVLPDRRDAELDEEGDVVVLPGVHAAEEPERVPRAALLGEGAVGEVGALAAEEGPLVADAEADPALGSTSASMPTRPPPRARSTGRTPRSSPDR